MTTLTFTQLINRTLELSEDAGSLEAYQFITEHARDVQGNKAQIFNYRYALAGAAGLEQEALTIMREAIIECGYWYGYDYLIEDEDLQSLHKYEAFQEMVQRCKEREAKAQQTAIPVLKVIRDENRSEDESQILLISLHGDQENIEISEGYWKSIVSAQCMLALPQSSQIQFSDSYDWEDVDKGVDELQEHYHQLVEIPGRDTANVIVGGFSAGAGVALNALLSREISAKGFILVAPWLPEIEEWEPLLDTLAEKNMKGYVICGNDDEDCYESTLQLVTLLDEKNVDHVFIEVDGLDHDYPDNFEQLLNEATEYIIG
ncbi:putative esterase [Paenibacillus sp. DS2015]|uniref:alpha/beta hydrolase n=1 Tax=Paenibacillus sp. DS2015 TaxID=3373917 RepID=UPI003D194AAA